MGKRYHSPYLVRLYNCYCIYRLLDYGMLKALRAAIRAAGKP
jgi:hypothetical protein